MNLQEKIDFLCAYGNDKLVERLPQFRVHFANSDKTYVGIASRAYSLSNKDKEGGLGDKLRTIEASIIFINGGIWQYHFLNVSPISKRYIDANEYLDIIIGLLETFDK